MEQIKMNIFKIKKQLAETQSKLLGARLAAIVANDRLGGMNYTTDPSKPKQCTIPSFLLKKSA